MKIINIDVIKQTYDVSPVEGDVNVIKVKFINTPSEWLDNGYDEYGVYALFTKDNDSEIMNVDKATMECAVPNRMIAENSGLKVTLYAMNSDTANPRRYVVEPVWIAISEGYEVSATSGLNIDNMDAISSLIQAISKYPVEEQKRVEAENKRAEAELLREGMVKDLGSYDNIDNYNQAIDGAKTSGLYKIQYTDDVKTVPCVFLVISGVDFAGKELVYQMLMRGAYLNENETSIPLMRVCTDGAWSDRIYQFESSYYKNSNIIDNANSEEMYPTNKGVSDYVFSEVNKLIGGAPDAYNTLGKIATAIGNHVNNNNNPHQVTKNQLGLDNVNNTSDEDKPLSSDAREALGTKLDKSNIVTDYQEWFETSKGDDFDDKVPSIGVFSNFYETSGYFLRHSDIYYDINSNDVYPFDAVPHVEGVKSYVHSALHPTPITEIPERLEPNKEYNFGWVSELSLSFPSIANDGDVIYATFFAEDTSDDMQPNLIIDTTNTSDIELIPEQSTGYEIFARYNGEIWIVNYSEYTRTW